MEPAKNAVAQAIRQAEKAMRRKARGMAETPQERGCAAANLAKERGKKRRAEAQMFVQQARRLGLDCETLTKISNAAKAYAEAHENWIFSMISPAQQADVIRWINRNSKRPHKAVELWATLLEHLHHVTGEIMATRQDLADRVGETPQNLSSIMTELASINAIRRVKEGRNVRYFLNPNIATHLPTAAARAKAREEAGPLLKLMEGGRQDNEHG